MSDRQGGKTTGCLVGCLFFGLVSLLVMSLVGNGVLVASFIAGHAATSFEGDVAEDEMPVLTSTWSYGSGDVLVVRIPLYGVITRSIDEGIFSQGEDMVESTIHQIRAAMADDEIRAIILEIDSPGGAITPTDEIYKALQDFRDSAEDRRIVAFCRGLAASGGYYVAAAADSIVAEPTSIIGSISVIMQTLNWKTLSERIGITDVTITSGEYKDMLNPFKEVDEKEKAIIQEMVDGLYEHFLAVVCEGRELTLQELKPYADGRVFLPETAREAGLIDQVGYWDEVMIETASQLGVEQIKVMRYEQPQSIWDLFASMKLDLSARGVINSAYPRFMYLWNP